MIQVLLNLLSNAVKFTEQGYIRLRSKTTVENSREVLCISVKDTGVGIQSEDIGKLFQEFAMLDSNRSLNPNGTGLGLYLSRKLVQLMHGDLVAKSVFGAGSKFSLQIPFEYDHEGEDCKHLEPPIMKSSTPPEQSSPPPATASMLVADDSDLNLHVLSSMLAKLNAACDKVKNGVEAVNRVEARGAAAVGPRHYSLILMDINMPVMSGLQVSLMATT